MELSGPRINRLLKPAVLGVFIVSAISARAGTQRPTVVEEPPVKTTEPWEIKVAGPGWRPSAGDRPDRTQTRGENFSRSVRFGRFLLLVQPCRRFNLAGTCSVLTDSSVEPASTACGTLTARTPPQFAERLKHHVDVKFLLSSTTVALPLSRMRPYEIRFWTGAKHR